MAYCIKCGKESIEGNFCNECGTSLVSAISTTNNVPNNSTTSPWQTELFALGLPLMIISQVKNLSHAQQTFFLNQYESKRKSKFLAYLLWFFVGLHYVYVGKWGMQFLFWFTAGGFGIWWFIDLFRMSGIIANKNNDIAVEILLLAKHF